MISTGAESNPKVLRPPLYGLVLAGGRSTRMGQDKGSMQWHGKEHRLHMAHLLKTHCAEVYISCRQEQAEQLNDPLPLITDIYPDQGPLGAILSAFKSCPHVAWLVAACDLPLLDAPTLAHLVVQRDTNRIATAFQSPHDGLPEPLITIWEPGCYHLLSAALDKGYHSPKKVLLHSTIKLITANNPMALMNVNTPAERERAQQLLNSRY